MPTREYLGKRIYFLTLCCEERRPLFHVERVGLWAIRELGASAARFDFLVHAYCFMPDHAHFLVEATKETCELRRFAADFKQRTGYAYQKRTGRRLWQTKYYDHVLRAAEYSETVAWYIWLNPVRKGLCEKPHDHGLSGSMTVDWNSRRSPRIVWEPPWKASQKLPG